MKTQKKYEKRNGIVLILGAVLIAGASATLTAGICTDWFRTNPFEKSEKDPSSGLETSIKEDGVSLKLLATTTTSEGYVVKTFGFTITPSNASDQTVNAEAKYNDGSDAADVIAVSVDNDAKTISLTNKGAFSQQIVVTVTSNANAAAKATITVDYVKKLLEIRETFAAGDFGYNFGGSNQDNYNISDFSISSMITPEYSVYTKDKNYTFAVKGVSVFCDYENGNWMVSSGLEFFNTIKDPEAILRKIEKMIEERMLSGGALPTAEEIWNIDSDSGWHSYLSYVSENHLSINTDDYISFDFDATYYCVEDPSIELNFRKEGDANIGLSLDYDYSDKTVEVSGITVEVPSIEF